MNLAARTRRALFLAGDLPWPPDGGGRIATLRVLEAFSAGFEVDVVALAESARPIEMGPLRGLCASVEVVPHPFTFRQHPARQLLLAATSTFSGDPYRLRKFRSAAFAAAVRARLAARTYDVVHHDQFGVVPYRPSDAPTTMTHQNVESDLYRLAVSRARDPARRAWLRHEQAKLARAEATLLADFDEVFVLADEDARLLANLGVTRTSVLPIPAPVALDPRPAPAEPTILSLGSMSWFGVEDGLLWFADSVLPRVRAAVPDARWRIVGAHPGSRIRELGQQPGIEVLGHVPELGPIIADSRVAIVPLHVAGGIRMKLLDLMAWGVPSVATTLAARGLDAADGQGVIRRDDVEGFADAVTSLLLDDSRWIVTTSLGRRFVSEHHRPEHLADAVRDGVDRAIARRAAREAS